MIATTVGDKAAKNKYRGLTTLFSKFLLKIE
jgi:hypothetical protein